MGVTGVTEVVIGDGGSGATGDRATMLIVALGTDSPNVGRGASMRSTGKERNTKTMYLVDHFLD